MSDKPSKKTIGPGTAHLVCEMAATLFAGPAGPPCVVDEAREFPARTEWAVKQALRICEELEKHVDVK